VDVSVSVQRPRSVPGSLTQNWGGAEFGVSIPVPFMSVANRGELRGARHAADRAELQVRAAEARVESEVRQAFTRYELARARAAQYSDELLADAEKVLAGRLYSYQRGNEPLIEVLLAQRAADEIYLAAYEAIGESLKALVALQDAAGLSQQLGGGK
jgi:outer membrane protein TolC